MASNDHQINQLGSGAERLSDLFQAYRAACPDPEASANFMPELWRQIEGREGVSMGFGRVARNLVTAALALSTLLAFAFSIERSWMAPLPSETYVEVLAEDLDYLEPVHIAPVADQR
jgi:hypothetical protein